MIAAVLILLASFVIVIDAYKLINLNTNHHFQPSNSIKKYSQSTLAAATSASLKPQLSKLIARQDLTTEETEVYNNIVLNTVTN